MRNIRVAAFIAGEKGRGFLASMLDEGDVLVTDVYTYAQRGTIDAAEAEIATLCLAAGVRVHTGARTAAFVEPDVDLVFVVGWQYLLPHDPRMVVFHDSLLPRYRGFAPTVAALIAGEPQIGVTALRPVAEADAGPILAQHARAVHYPAKIRDVLRELEHSYVACAREVISAFANGDLVATPQDETAATYSIWRDDQDYFIDWTADADRICRTIDALGWPYLGARTMSGTEQLVIREAVPGPDLHFALPQPGKIWSLSEGRPTVTCGRGTVILTDVRDTAGDQVTFDRLRVRLG